MASQSDTAAPYPAAAAAGPLFNRTLLIHYGIACLSMLIVIGPLAPIVYQSLIDRPLYDSGQQLTLQNYTAIFTNSAFTRAIPNTLIFGVLSTLIGTVFGVVGAILVGRTNLPGRRFFGEMMMWPIFISHLVLAFGWVIVYGPAGYITSLVAGATGYKPFTLYSLFGMSLVAGIASAPLTFLYCMASTALSESTLEDAARTCGCGPIRSLFAITLPLMQPAIFYSVILNFTGALEMLAIPLALGEPSGINVFATLLYTQGVAALSPDYGLVSTAAMLLILVVFLLLLAQRRLLRNSRRFVTLGGKAGRPRTVDLGLLRWPVFALFLTLVLVFILIPIGAIFLRASVSILTPLIPFWELFTTKHFVAVFNDPTNVRSITNSLLVATGAGILGTFFVALVTIIIHRSDFRFSRGLEYVALLPRAIPGVVAGMGFFYAIVMFPPIGWMRSTIWIIMIAYIARFIPMALGAMSPSLMQIGRELDSSARVVGADWWRASRSIILPLMKPAMLSSFTLIFVISLKEYATAIYLFTPGNEVLGVSLLFNWINGDVGVVAVLAVVQIVLTMVFVYGARWILGIRIFGN